MIKSLGEPNLVMPRNPQVLFLSETKCGEEITNKIKFLCKFKGGLCPLWEDKNLTYVQSYSQNHIDSEINWRGRL